MYTENAISVFNGEGERLSYKPRFYLNKVIYLEKLGRDEEARKVLRLLYGNIDSFKSNIGVVIQIHEQFANLLLKSGSPLRAEEYAKKGLNIAWENHENRRLFSIWTLLGNIYNMLGKQNEAKIRYVKALAYTKYVEEDSPDRIARTRLAYGKLLVSMNEKEEAERQLLLSVEIFQRTKTTDIHYIEAIITLGRLKNSEKLLQLADEIISNGNHMESISIDNIVLMCDFYESSGNQKKFNHYNYLLYKKTKEVIAQ